MKVNKELSSKKYSNIFQPPFEAAFFMYIGRMIIIFRRIV